MGYGPIVNGKQKPITPYKGSWAHTMELKRKRGHMSGLIESIEKNHAALKGSQFGYLSDAQKRDLYAYHLWQDGAEPEIADDTSKHSDPVFVDWQLRSTFDYTDGTTIL